MAADYPTMTTAEIRSAYLNFFESKGCKLYPSSSLVPDDPSLLLANAGMNQFKEFYQGKKVMKEIGACSCQKCVRTNDIDIIGADGRHASFFEMLGNFAFGGVTKGQACAWAYELVTEVFKLPKDRLYFTVFTEDDETEAVWRSLGVEPDHITRLGEDDNFWAAGPTGPCGPCSEIYFDLGEEVGCGCDTCAPRLRLRPLPGVLEPRVHAVRPPGGQLHAGAAAPQPRYGHGPGAHGRHHAAQELLLRR